MKKRTILIVVAVAVAGALAAGVIVWALFGEHTKVMTGRVTRLALDCQPAQVFENGQIRTELSTLCDGGDGLEVDGTYFSASSGMVANSEDAWSTSLDDVEAGDKVEVMYVEKRYDSGSYKSLDCDACSVTVISKYQP